MAACSGGKKPDDAAGDVTKAFWPVFRGDRNLSGIAEVRPPENPVLLWTFNTEHDIISSPVVGYGNVYICSTDGKVYALDLAGGGKTWEFDSEDDIEASPLLLDRALFIGNLSGHFFSLDALSGTIRWNYDIDGDIMGSANWADVPGGTGKLVFVGSYNTMMYCFNAENGDSLWTYATDNYINGAPATDGRSVVFGGCDEKLHIVSAVDGTKKGEVFAGSYIAGSAALVDNCAYVGHYGGKLVCIDVEEQNIAWEYGDDENGSEFFSSPAVGKKRIIIGSRDYNLHCVDRETGKQLWKFQTRDVVDSSPVIAGNSVVFGSTDGRLYILDIEDGKEIWSYEIGAAILGCPAVLDGMIIIGAKDGRIYAFGDNT